jgi:alkyl hydroperoxide reductase subunit AhpC
MANNVESVSRDHPVIAVASLSGSHEDVAEYLQGQGVTIPAVVDPEGQLASAYGVHAYPTSFIVDRTGEIRFAEVGYTTEAGLRLRLWLAERW